jgi:FdhD protein
MCTPIHLEALAIGFLFNEGIIKSMDDVADVRPCENGDNVDVWLIHSVNSPKTGARPPAVPAG